jgi:hypothetical protein
MASAHALISVCVATNLNSLVICVESESEYRNKEVHIQSCDFLLADRLSTPQGAM